MNFGGERVRIMRENRAGLGLPEEWSEPTADEVSGTVRRLWKHNSGYEVKVVITADDLSFEVELETSFDDPAEAIETTRKWLQRLGLTMAQAFDRPGSLK